MLINEDNKVIIEKIKILYAMNKMIKWFTTEYTKNIWCFFFVKACYRNLPVAVSLQCISICVTLD